MSSLIAASLAAVAAVHLCICSLQATSVAAASSVEASEGVRVCFFNVQVFGRAKTRQAEVMRLLVRILQRCDVTAVMEIRDASGTAIQRLQRQLNSASNNEYRLYVSARSGRTVSKEQYALLYRSSKASVQAASLVPDPLDRYQREPLLARLWLRLPDGRRLFHLLVLHTDPEETPQELQALYQTASGLLGRRLVIGGDLNADCSYLTTAEKLRLPLRTDSRLRWLIPDSADTTVKRTHCAYDRIIVSPRAGQRVASSRVFRFDEEFGVDACAAAEVSDHYPVEVMIV